MKRGPVGGRHPRRSAVLGLLVVVGLSPLAVASATTQGGLTAAHLAGGSKSSSPKDTVTSDTTGSAPDALTKTATSSLASTTTITNSSRHPSTTARAQNTTTTAVLNIPPTTAPATTSTSSAHIPYDSVVLGDHPVAFWDIAGSGTEVDRTGNGHTGTWHGAPSVTTLPDGELARDFNVGMSGQYLSVPSSSSFSISATHQLTWEAWIRPDSLGFDSTHDTEGYDYVDFLGKCQSYSPSCEYEGRMYTASDPQYRCSRISGYVFNPTAGQGSAADWQPAAANGNNSMCTSSIFHAGEWLHVVVEYQTLDTPAPCDPEYPGTINIWVNGVEQDFAYHQPTGCMSQHDVLPVASSSPFDVGTMALETWFPGAIGKVALYNYLLSPNQIAGHFRAMTGTYPSGSCADVCTIPPAA